MARPPLPPAPGPEKGWRRRLAVPSLLAPALDERIKEVMRGTFSQHAIETVCIDLRIRRTHAVTGQFAREIPRVQDAIDRFIIAYYQPAAASRFKISRRSAPWRFEDYSKRQELSKTESPSLWKIVAAGHWPGTFHPQYNPVNTTDVPAVRRSSIADEPFCTTRWTIVLAARGNSLDARAALSALCEAYYEPVLVYLRRALGDSTSVRNVAHEFFAELLQGNRLDAAAPERGKFRAYLSGALKHFIANHRAYQRRQRRGGDQQALPLHPTTDSTPGVDPAADHRSSPDAAFDRAWATTLLGRALATLRAECEAEGKGAQFDWLKPWLT
jgi:RNA polymerase sigma-70 factor (ECF subfamily)